MSKVKTMNKYCLKGEYYEALEVINIRLKYSVSTSFRKEVLLDLIDLFYRNQELGNTLSETIGGSLDNFISEILDSYYSTLGTKKFLNYLFQNGLLVSIVSALFYIAESKIGNNAEPIAFATILCAIGGFIMGVSSYYVGYKLLYKKSSTFVNLVQTLFSLIPIEIIILFNDKIDDVTKHIEISKNVVLVIIVLEIIIYVCLLVAYKFNRESEGYVK